MELKNQVCSLELSKRLKELGVKQESLWWWVFQEEVWKLENRHIVKMISGMIGMSAYPKLTKMPPIYSAFTVAELYKILSELNPHWDFNNSVGLIPEQVANFLAEEIINLLENKLMEVNDGVGIKESN